MKVTTFFILIVILMTFAISQTVEIGSETKETGVNIVLPELPTFNNNTAFVNASNFWVTNSLGPLDDANTTQFESVGGTLTINQTFFNDVYIPYTGATADVDLGDKKVLTTGFMTIRSDSSRLRLGGGDDVNIFFNGADLIIVSRDVTANDEIWFREFDKYDFDNDIFTTGDLTATNLIADVWRGVTNDDERIVFTDTGIVDFYSSGKNLLKLTGVTGMGAGNSIRINADQVDADTFIFSKDGEFTFALDGLLDTLTLGDGGITNYAEFSKTGDLTLFGSAKAIIDTLVLDGGSITDTSGAISFGDDKIQFGLTPDSEIFYNGTDFLFMADAQSNGWVDTFPKVWNPTARFGGTFEDLNLGDNTTTWLGYPIFSFKPNIFLLFENKTITVNEVKWTPRTTFDLNKIFRYIR
ncbi:hypothetical protein LCGC14_2403330, partial [marine sediment metagenome]